MYKISVPVMINDRFDREKVLTQLKKIHAQRVFFALEIISLDMEKRKDFGTLGNDIKFFQFNGFEVGVWVWTFWRTNIDLVGDEMPIVTGFDGKKAYESNACDTSGKIESAFMCPSSVAFRADTCDYVSRIAALGPDIIMFDDDFRYGNLPTGFGCCCDNHLKMMSQTLGETVQRDGLREKIFCGGENKYRTAWLGALGDAMKLFARDIRTAVDKINPNIRIATCACMSTWDLDGVDSATIAKILAGNTKPLLRLSGAPYWGVHKFFGMRLQHCIEFERMESRWCDGVELMSEGDVYPRPRHACPSSALEGFDLALRCDGRMDGILKYMLSYTSSPEYEKGYTEAHIKNEKLYEQIEKHFTAKNDYGVRAFEVMNKLEKADLPSDRYIGDDYLQAYFYSRASKLLSDNTIPASYTATDSACVVFGENAKYLPEEMIGNGLILDYTAAEILTDRGVDVGIESFGERIENAPLLYYPLLNEYIESNYSDRSVYCIQPKKSAEILTYCGLKGKENPDTIFYKNDNGQRFIVFAFDAYQTSDDRYRSYAMQNTLYDYIDRLSKPLKVKCKGNPDLYIICREDENELAVGLLNFCADAIDSPIIELAEEYRSAEFIACNGKLAGDKVILDKLHAYEYAFVVLEK